MKMLAQRHYDATRWIGNVAWLLGIVVFTGVILLLGWHRFAPLSWDVKLFFGFIVVWGAVWVSLVPSRLLCEIIRETVCARCSKCGGQTWLDSDPEGGFSTQNVTYTCRQCGFREELKTTYRDEVPFRQKTGGPDYP